MHVRNDVREGGAREQLEAALRVADATRRRRRQDGEYEMERPHQEVPQRGPLHHRLAANEMGAAADRDASVGPVHHLLATLYKLSQVTESRSPVGVGEEHVRAACVPQAMGHAATFAAVLLERDDAQDVVQAVLARKLQRDLRRPVTAPVVDDDDLVAGEVLARGVVGVEMAARGRRARRGVLSTALWPQVGAPAVSLIEVLDCFLEGGQDAVFLVVGREHHGHQHLGWLDGSGVGYEACGGIVPDSL